MTAFRTTGRRRTVEPGSMSVLALTWRRYGTALDSAARGAVEGISVDTVCARRGL